jgi:hypothetical protein
MDLSARSSALTFFFFLSHQLIPRTNLKAYSLLSQQPASQPASRGSVYFHYTRRRRRRRRRNKKKRWNEKSVVSLFLLGVHKLLSLKILIYLIFKEGENISFLIR